MDRGGLRKEGGRFRFGGYEIGRLVSEFGVGS